MWTGKKDDTWLYPGVSMTTKLHQGIPGFPGSGEESLKSLRVQLVKLEDRIHSNICKSFMRWWTEEIHAEWSDGCCDSLLHLSICANGSLPSPSLDKQSCQTSFVFCSWLRLPDHVRVADSAPPMMSEEQTPPSGRTVCWISCDWCSDCFFFQLNLW